MFGLAYSDTVVFRLDFDRGDDLYVAPFSRCIVFLGGSAAKSVCKAKSTAGLGKKLENSSPSLHPRARARARSSRIDLIRIGDRLQPPAQ